MFQKKIQTKLYDKLQEGKIIFITYDKERSQIHKNACSDE